MTTVKKKPDNVLKMRTGSLKFSRRKMLAIGAATAVSGLATACGKVEGDKAEHRGSVDSSIKYDAIVIGAGLSGLHAAMLLEEQGLNVLTLEGRNRIGGRVYTLMDIPGKPEAAGEYIGGNYARMLDTARRLGLELFEPDLNFRREEKLYSIRGETFTGSEWEGHALNPLKDEDRKILPERMLSVLSHRDNPLSGRALDEWINPEFAQYDIPHNEYLKKYLGYNDETIRLMNVIIHSDHINNTSAMNELRRYAVNEFNSKMADARPDLPDAQQVRGGNSLITQAMADSLKNGVSLNKSVHTLEDNGQEVAVHCTDGTSYTAKQVVNSMPISVMKSIKYTNRLPQLMEEAVADMSYGISIQVHYLIEREFWNDDGLPKNMWTDTPFERFAVLNKGDDGGPSSAIAFINGNEAYKYDFMSDEQVAKYTTQQLINIRPALKNALKPVMVQSCHRDLHGSGDWVFWRPGQVSKFAPYMRERHGNVHFAGEHTALMERGMEGAFESGERAAFDLLGRT